MQTRTFSLVRYAALSLVLMLTLAGCQDAAAQFKSLVRNVVSEALAIIAVVTIATAIIKPMVAFLLKIVVVALFEENWQFSSLSVNIASSVIGGIIGVFITVNAGIIVDTVTEFIRGLW